MTGGHEQQRGGETRCLMVIGGLLAIAIVLPPISQPAAYHAFADQRSLLGVPRAADVLSSLAFVVAGLAAVARLSDRARPRARLTATEAGLWATAIGLALTGVGSMVYHLDPRDATLAWDRLPMTLAFAGVLAISTAQRVSRRAAWLVLPAIVLLGAASVLYWRASGNLAPYVVVQAGTALALVVAALRPRGDDPFPWRWVVAWYAIAKAFELSDTQVFAATAGLISGHTLKHLAAAAAGVALLWPLLVGARAPRP